jgi:hypothetical protein
VNILIANLRFIIRNNPVAHSSIGISDGSGSLIHHTVGLECIKKEVIKYPVQSIARIVGVPKNLVPIELITFGINVNFHCIINGLLPVSFPLGITALKE